MSLLKGKESLLAQQKTSLYRVQQATEEDMRGLIELLASKVPNVSVNTVWQVPWDWQHYHVVRDVEGNVIGSGALMPDDMQRSEIRGIAVHDDHRGMGLASRIIKSLIEKGLMQGRDVHCVTRCPDYFARFGFKETVHEWLDMSTRQTARVTRQSGVEGPVAPRVSMVLVHDRYIQ